MKLTCDTIKDMLPLYVENIACHDTCVLVEEHIESCENCEKELASLRDKSSPPIDTNILPLKRIQSLLSKQKFLTIILSVIVTITIAILVIGYLTTPEYFSYVKSGVNIMETEDKTVLVDFKGKVSGYSIEKYYSDDGKGYVYHIAAWNNYWNRFLNKKNIAKFVLNPDEEAVLSVYYSSNDGNEDTLVYGTGQVPYGGMISLPRLTLGYYAYIAAFIVLVLSICWVANRRSKNGRMVISNLLVAPLGYLLANLLIKGFNPKSYSFIRDFYLIILIMFLLIFVMMLGVKLVRDNRK